MSTVKLSLRKEAASRSDSLQWVVDPLGGEIYAKLDDAAMVFSHLLEDPDAEEESYAAEAIAALKEAGLYDEAVAVSAALQDACIRLDRFLTHVERQAKTVVEQEQAEQAKWEATREPPLEAAL